MSNDSFFSHYPFFTPPPQSADEALMTEAPEVADGGGRLLVVQGGLYYPEVNAILHLQFSPDGVIFETLETLLHSHEVGLEG